MVWINSLGKIGLLSRLSYFMCRSRWTISDAFYFVSQFNRKERAVEAGCLLLELCEAALLVRDTALCMALAPFLASHTRTLVSLAVDPSTCLRIMRELVQVAPESSNCSLLLLAYTISVCPPPYLHSVIMTCKYYRDQKSRRISYGFFRVQEWYDLWWPW